MATNARATKNEVIEVTEKPIFLFFIIISPFLCYLASRPDSIIQNNLKFVKQFATKK